MDCSTSRGRASTRRRSTATRVARGLHPGTGLKEYYDAVRRSTTTLPRHRGFAERAGRARRQSSTSYGDDRGACRRSGRSTSPAAPGSSPGISAATSSASTRAPACSTRRAAPAPHASLRQGDALALPFPDDSFDRVFTGHFYGHLEVPERDSSSRGAARGSRARLVDASKDPAASTSTCRRASSATARPGRSTSATSPGRGSLTELGGGDVLFEGAWFVVVRAALRAEPGRELPPVSYRSLASLQRDQRTCRACVEAGYPLESWPVLAPLAGQRAYLFGQAPGDRRGRRAPAVARTRGQDAAALARARRGQVLRHVLLRVGHALLSGPGPSGRGDRTPTPEEQRLCEYWRDHELRLLRPQLIVTVGGLAARRLLGVKSVTECVGARYEHGGAVAIPLPHPSGASSWLNVPGEPRAGRRRRRADPRASSRVG